ncbi:hypothetical protein HG535_0A01450 [Zygotorulaspora mrakii]|uniref:Uncharacterized protein n=1 Tax=Zygotorulaspora mrakii TaxID=42260 RepID=A0A7H9AVM3_ZYGMR|nr:uncharacterized protein HG535_0A01450 [Zygotorulaspora mrakii]QLG70207.1 hypothetical protein HG535_0A01450 [Zygotorulaspora mrakii]
MTEYTAHFIPCKVRYNGATEEFVDNFHCDNEDDLTLKRKEDDSLNGEKLCVRHIRGRKIVGKKFLGSDGYQTFLVKTGTREGEDGETGQISLDTTSKIEPIAKISSMINYERDGNEERLLEELEKFQQFLDVSDVIHS